MSHFLGLTILSAFVVVVVVLLGLSGCLAVRMSYLSVCVHNLVC